MQPEILIGADQDGKPPVIAKYGPNDQASYRNYDVSYLLMGPEPIRMRSGGSGDIPIAGGPVRDTRHVEQIVYGWPAEGKTTKFHFGVLGGDFEPREDGEAGLQERAGRMYVVCEDYDTGERRGAFDVEIGKGQHNIYLKGQADEEGVASNLLLGVIPNPKPPTQARYYTAMHELDLIQGIIPTELNS